MNIERQKLKIKKDDTTENRLNMQQVRISPQDRHRVEADDQIKEGDRRKFKTEEFKKNIKNKCSVEANTTDGE